MQTTKKLLFTLSLILLWASLGLSQSVRCSDCGGESGGENPDAIDIHFPPCGKIVQQLFEFRWDAKENANVYTVEIKEPMPNGRSSVVHSKATENTAVLIDLTSLNLTTGKEYTIVVKSDNNKQSNEASFSILRPMDYQQALLDIQDDRRYQVMSGVNKALRKAELLRDKNWNLEALKSYDIEVDNLADIIKVNTHFNKFVTDLFPRGADGCAGM